jgi:hypothetical protein
MTPMLRDVRLDGGQLGHLMAPRLADLMLRIQGVLALAARVRHVVDDRLHAVDRDEGAMVPRMSGLTARLAPTLDASTAHAWLTRETIGGGRFRRRRGILLPQRELAFEIRNPFRLLGDLFAEMFILLLQSFNLTQLAITGVARVVLTSRSLSPLWLHQPERTKSLHKVQVQNLCQFSSVHDRA